MRDALLMPSGSPDGQHSHENAILRLAHSLAPVIMRARKLSSSMFCSTGMMPYGSAQAICGDEFATRRGPTLSLIHISEPTRPY